MSTNRKWTLEEEHLLKLLRATNTYQEIENEFQKRVDKNLPGFPCTRTSEAVRKKCDRDDITPESCKSYSVSSNTYQDRWDSINAIQAIYKEKCIAKTVGLIDPLNLTTKILSVSDIHFPLARADLLKEVIETHSDADIVVVNGDLLEGYVFSSFEKAKRIAAIHEYNCAFDFVQTLSENFPKVVLVEGNHDNRPSRALKQAGFNKDGSQVLRPCLMARIANGEKLDQTGMLVEKLDFDNVIFEPNESWYVKVGKTLFIHPSTRGSGKPGATVGSWEKKFSERYDHGDYDSVVCGHTHKIYKGIINGKMLIEQGCLAGLMAYSWRPHVLYHGNGQNGYAVIYQDADGNTDFNSSGPIYLGEVVPPKKSAI